MKTYEVVLTKSYIVKIRAENKNSAKEFLTFFTSDITNIADEEDMKKYNFVIENISCKTNEIFEIVEINENN